MEHRRVTILGAGKMPANSEIWDQTDHTSTGQEVRCAVRFPLTLPVVISNGKDEYTALTNNVSASGVLFEMNSPLTVPIAPP